MLVVALSRHWVDRKCWPLRCPDTGLADNVEWFDHHIVVMTADFDHQIVSLSLFDGAVGVSAFWAHEVNNVCGCYEVVSSDSSPDFDKSGRVGLMHV